MKNKLLKAGVILAVLAVAVLAMAGAGAADSHTHNGVTFDKAISTADELTSLFTNGGSGYLTADIKGHDFTVSGTVKLCLNGHKIDASNTNYRAIRIDGGSLDLYDCTSSGEITGGKADEGAGVYVSNGTFAMHGGKITNCTANNYGGGVYLADGSTFTMENGAIISGCTANGSGGGVYILDSDSFFSMNGSTISNCKANTGRGGGVHLNTGSTFAMSGDSTISGCTADTYGGGVYLADNSLFVMDKGTITGCTANGSGGGVYIFDSESFFSMTGSIISNCKATTGRGGGVHLNQGSTFTMSDSTISYCSAGTYGGGVHIEPGGVFTMSGDSTVSNCTAAEHGGGVYNGSDFIMNGGTISNNTATVNGGGVYVTDGAVFTMKSGSITANTGKLGGGVLVNYAVFKMEGGSITGNTATVEGGGVYLANASRYKNTDGTISGNTNGDIINKIHDGWTKIEDEEDLEEFFDDGGYGYLDTKDVFEGDFLIDKYKKNVYLDLNGRQIKGKDESVSGLVEAVAAIQVTGNATLYLYDSSEDGKGYITGTNTVEGDGAGILLNTGTLYLYTGNVRNCTTPSNGAGVYLDYRSYFYMYSGATIENCTSSSWCGGGVKLDGMEAGYRNRFYMYGGTISGCSAAKGAGVYATSNSIAEIYGGKIINCTARDFGGGIRLFDGSITRYGGYIKDNTPDNIYSDETSEETFNIRYYGIDGAEVSNPATISTGSDITLNNPVKSGFTFTGWIGSNLPEKTMNAVIDCGYGGDRTFIATWAETPTHTVTFDVQGHGETPESQTVNDGEKVKEPEDPEAEGYAFEGWYTDSACTYAYDFDTPVHKDFTLYAKWTQICFVSFDMNGHGASPEGYPKSVEYGTVITRPADPTAEGYAFEGWYTDSACTNAYNFDTQVTEDTTIYAKWIPVYKVSFIMNGHGTQVPSQDVEEGTCAIRPADPAETGYTFDNWYSNASCTSVYDFSTPVTDNLVLYAKWNPVTFTVTFDSAGGSTVSPATVNYGGLVPEPQNVIRDGHLLTGWFKDDTAWNFAADKVYDNMTLTAHWEEYDRYFPVSTQANNCIIDAPDSALSGTTVTVTVSADNGARLSNLQVTKSDGSSVTAAIQEDEHDLIWKATFTMPRDSVTVSAAADMVTCEVTFDSAGGSAVSPATVSYGGLVSEPSVSRDGYILTGWRNGGIAWDFSTDRVYENMTLMAEWEEEPEQVYSITLDEVENATLYSSVKSAGEGSDVKIAIRSDSGAKVTGLNYTTSSGGFVDLSSVVSKTEDGTVWYYLLPMPADNITISGSAEPLEYTVTFDSAGGTSVSPAIVKHGELVPEPQNVTRDGYLLTGWYNGTDLWNFATDKVYENLELTAEWKEEEPDYYSITAGDVDNGVIYVQQKQAAGGEQISYTFTADDDYALESLTVKREDGTVIAEPAVSGESTYTGTFTMPESNVILEGTTKCDVFNVSSEIISGAENGVFTADRTKAKTGETVRFTAEPYAGYAVTDNTVTINGKEVELTMQDENSGYAEYTVLDEDVLGTVSFERGIFTITVESPALPARMVTDKSTAKADEDVKIAARPGIKRTVTMFSIYDTETSELLDIAIPEYDAEKHFYSGTFSMPKADVTVKADIEDKEGAFKITKGETENGKIVVAPLGLSGTPRLIKAVPDTGYHTDSVTVTDSSGQTVTVEELGNDIYRFIMPASDVVVTAAFRTDTPVPETSSERSTVTAFDGEKNGTDFTFSNAVVITKATLPGATYAKVINTSGSGWYTCNLATDGTSGTVYFQVPLDVIDIKGYTINDVSMLGCKTTYLKSENGYAKYSAVITGAGSYTIGFEKDAAQKAAEKVQEVVEQKQTATEQKQAAAEKVQEVVEQKQTTQTAAKTPFPVLGILAGLGIAGLAALRRH